MSLSLTPRYDLFRFVLPKTFLPEEINTKYQKLLNREAGVVTTPIDYLNESIQSVHIPGMSGLTMEQPQIGYNTIVPTNTHTNKRFGKINVEPNRSKFYESAQNPLELIEKELRVTFRMNQGLYNYYMLYETIFYHYCKHINFPSDDLLYIEILDETGVVSGRIKFYDLHIDGIDGLDFSYEKVQRETGTFDIVFKFNNIDFEFVDVTK